MSIEATVEKPICTWAEKQGWFVRKLQWAYRVGAPDRLFIKDGRVVFIEFKRPAKSKLVPEDKRTEMQKREADRLIEAGAEYHLVNDIADACRILGIRNLAAEPYPKAPSRRSRRL